MIHDPSEGTDTFWSGAWWPNEVSLWEVFWSPLPVSRWHETQPHQWVFMGTCELRQGEDLPDPQIWGENGKVLRDLVSSYGYVHFLSPYPGMIDEEGAEENDEGKSFMAEEEEYDAEERMKYVLANKVYRPWQGHDEYDDEYDGGKKEDNEGDKMDDGEEEDDGGKEQQPADET